MKLFDDWKSYVHFFVGAVACSTKDINIFAVTTLIFIIYQFLEKNESLNDKLCDIIEFELGALAGVIANTLFPQLI